MKQEKGLSLIELMISITLGLMLMLGVLNVFLGSKGAFVSQQAISHIQETGRFAIDYMNKEIRMAGFVGCASNVSDSQIINHLKVDSKSRWDYKVVIKGYIDTDKPFDLDDLVAGTDALEIVSASGSQLAMTGDSTTDTISVTATKAGKCGADDSYGGFCVNDILVASDCQQAQIFKAGSLNESQFSVATTGTSDGDNKEQLSGSPFQEGAEVIKMRKLLFYIKVNATTNVPGLWLWENGTSTELVEGVQDMHIEYGVDIDADGYPDEYKSSADVTDWTSVNSVHLELLVRTPETRVLTEPQPYTFPMTSDAKTVSTDRIMRQVFVSTIAVRSRLE